MNLNVTDHGSGLPVLWIHAFPLCSRLYAAQSGIGDCRHVIPDLPGFGSSPALDGSGSIEAYAGTLFSLLDDLRISRAVIAGMSMGGYIALAMMRREPERVAALVLSDTRETADTEDGRAGRRKMIEEARAEGQEAVARAMMPKLLSSEAPADVVANVRSMIAEASVEGIVFALEAMASRPDSTDVLRTAQVPVLTIAGSEDPITPPADAHRMHSLARDGEVAILQDAGHLANLEHPIEFNRTVSEFLASRRGRITAR